MTYSYSQKPLQGKLAKASDYNETLTNLNTQRVARRADHTSSTVAVVSTGDVMQVSQITALQLTAQPRKQ